MDKPNEQDQRSASKMFRKAIKIKSNNQVKGSDRKNIREKLLQAFPNLSEPEIDTLLPKKEILSVIKITTAGGETVHVYTIEKQPMAFEYRGRIYPTIFLLWKLPDLVPAFTTHPPVMSYLSSGADLMLPGVITPPACSGLPKYNNVQEGDIAYVNLTDNQAAVAVGVAAQSSADMLTGDGRGKCLTIYHFYGDKLSILEGVYKPTLAFLGPPAWLRLRTYDQDFPALAAHGNKEVEAPPPNIETEIEATEPPEATKQETVESAICTVEEMDQLLSYCFFVAIKYSKTLTLPILTSNFFKLQMLPHAPDNKFLDIKKTSYKKLKPFLDAMSKEGLITVKEVKKGVESITAINKEHPKFTEFYVEPSVRPRIEQNSNDSPSTSVTESYIITPAVAPIFMESGLNKGDTLQMSQIRQAVTEYVKKNDCQNEENKRLVKPKEALIKICKTENCMTWEELMERVCEAMKSCYKVTSGTEEVLNKGKVSPITLTVSQRSGNKKVTLVDNLELFGIKITDFAKECQHGVAASTSINKVAGKKCDQLLVQGNQVLFVYNLLNEKYKIPAKYIRGLENAPKKRK